MDPGYIQSMFNLLKRLFDRAVLWTNFHKTVRVVLRPCQAAGVRE